MSSLDEVWARRNWLRSTAFLAVYYVFFTVIHGLNRILTTTNDPKYLFEIVFRVNANSSIILVLYHPTDLQLEPGYPPTIYR